jgi:outer membrane protein OmpA-like peptidoglycan-associated protein
MIEDSARKPQSTSLYGTVMKTTIIPPPAALSEHTEFDESHSLGTITKVRPLGRCVFLPSMKQHLIAILLLVSTSTCLAQRETFDTTVTRRLEVLIVEVLTLTSGPTHQRQGINEEGVAKSVGTTAKAVTIENILFKFDSAEFLNDASKKRVDEVAEALKKKELLDAQILIEGHTCDLGEGAYNDKLAAQRAAKIRHRLIQQGVAPDRLLALGFGERELIERVSSGDSPQQAEAKRMKNRRVVLRRIVPLEVQKR